MGRWSGSEPASRPSPTASATASTRPFFAGRDVTEVLSELYVGRAPAYEAAAHHVVDVDEIIRTRSPRGSSRTWRRPARVPRKTEPHEVSDVPRPTSTVAQAAYEVCATYSSPALLNHCRRSYVWAAALGDERGIGYDAELLYVSAMLHDIGLVEAFDNATLAFEDAGGHVAWVFGGSRLAGAAAPACTRGDRAATCGTVYVEADPEGYLLEVATGLDISGRNPQWWPDELRADVVDQIPRLGLAAEFTACFAGQAQRKPSSCPVPRRWRAASPTASPPTLSTCLYGTGRGLRRGGRPGRSGPQPGGSPLSGCTGRLPRGGVRGRARRTRSATSTSSWCCVATPRHIGRRRSLEGGPWSGSSTPTSRSPTGSTGRRREGTGILAHMIAGEGVPSPERRLEAIQAAARSQLLAGPDRVWGEDRVPPLPAQRCARRPCGRARRGRERRRGGARPGTRGGVAPRPGRQRRARASGCCDASVRRTRNWPCDW